MQSVKKLFWISRPVSWLNTAYPFAAGYLLCVGPVDWRFIVGTIFFLIPYNLLMYGINDVFDYESDIKNPRKGSIEGAVEQRAFHPVIVRVSILLALPFTITLLFAGGIISALVLMALLFFVIAYSAPGLRFKERPFLDSITSSIHFVGPLIYALSLAHFPRSAWPIVIAFFLWGTASHAFGAVQDILPDRAGKLASIATVIGASWTVRFSFLLYCASSLLIALQGGVAIIVGVCGLAYAVNVAPYLRLTDADSGRSNRGWRHFIWLNYGVGAVITFALLYLSII